MPLIDRIAKPLALQIPLKILEAAGRGIDRQRHGERGRPAETGRALQIRPKTHPSIQNSVSLALARNTYLKYVPQVPAAIFADNFSSLHAHAILQGNKALSETWNQAFSRGKERCKRRKDD